MKFFRFKRTTLKYFSKHMRLKKRYLRKLIQFNRFYVIADHPEKNIYTATYAFLGNAFQLQYKPINGWTLVEKTLDIPMKTYTKNQPTIEKCCDFIWEKED